MKKIVLFGQKDGNYRYISFDQEEEGVDRVPNICFDRFEYKNGRIENDQYNSTYYTKHREDYDIYEKGTDIYNLLLNKALVLINKTIRNSIQTLKTI